MLFTLNRKFQGERQLNANRWRTRPGARFGAWLVVIQLVLMTISWPAGNFPTNDDWAYAHSVQWLLTEHRIRLSDWIVG